MYDDEIRGQETPDRPRNRFCTDGSGLSLASEEIDQIADALNVSNQVRERATLIADRADTELPVNRSPQVVASSALYIAALLHNEKRTQEQVADAGDVSTVAIRDAYQEILRLDDELPGPPSEPRADTDHPQNRGPSIARRLLGVFRR